MSLVHDLLQDLDARWLPNEEDVKALPHSHSVRLGDSLRVPAANSVPAGLYTEPSDEEYLGRKPWVNGSVYAFLSGLCVLVLVIAWQFTANDKAQVESLVVDVLSSPSEQVLVAEVLQIRGQSGVLGGVVADTNSRFKTEVFSGIPTANTVSPLFKSNKVVELQERDPTALPVLNEVLEADLSSHITPVSRTDLPVFTEQNQELVASNENTRKVNVSIRTSVEGEAAHIVNKQPDQNEALVKDLLSRASRAFELQRYREPEGNNAFELYQAVLLHDKNNTAAKVGILDIKQAYLSLIRRVIVKDYYYKVPELTKNALAVGVSQSEIESVISSLPEKKEKTVRDALAQTKAYEQDKRQRKEATTLASDQGTVSVSEQTHDQKMAQEARQLIKAGKLSKAESILKSYVDSQPLSQASLQVLFSIYIQQQKLTEAESLIAQAQHLQGDQFSYLVAQLLIQRGDMAGAMRSLTSQQPVLSENPDYYALMAALYHKLGDDQLSQVLYQRLIAYKKTNPSYWLGLAMARDGLRAPAALQAFRQVQHLTTKPVTYSAYVAKRIDALSRLQDQ